MKGVTRINGNRYIVVQDWLFQFVDSPDKCEIDLLLFKNFSYQNLSLFLRSRAIISMFSVIFRFVSIFYSLFSIIFDLFYFFRSYTYKLCMCFSSVLSKFFLHDVVTPA